MNAPQVLWPGYPHAPAPLAAIRRAKRAHPDAQVVDAAGKPIAFGCGSWLREGLRSLWQRALDVPLAALARTVARKEPPVRTLQPGNTGPVVLVLPVLPDLSHTFLYREVLSLLRHRPTWRVVALEHNQSAPIHPEAQELLAHAPFAPRDGITARAVRLVRWLLCRRGREWFALHRCHDPQGASALLGKNPLRDSRHPGNAFALADWLAPLKPREIHVYGSTYSANVALGAAHLLGCAASISSYVDFEFDYAHKLLVQKAHRARFFRVVTRYCQQQLRAQPGLQEFDLARIPVIELGVDLAQWNAAARPSGSGVIVTAARFVPKKGLHLVPTALRLLRQQGLTCRWRLLGDGPERKALHAACAEQGVADLVDFLGARDTGAVRQELLAADLALLPSVVSDDGERDGIPVFLIEAMALGVPVVTTPVGGIPELIQDRVTGFLVPPGDAAPLAACLAALLARPALAQPIAEAGRRIVQERCDVNLTAIQLIERIEA